MAFAVAASRFNTNRAGIAFCATQRRPPFGPEDPEQKAIAALIGAGIVGNAWQAPIQRW